MGIGSLVEPSPVPAPTAGRERLCALPDQLLAALHIVSCRLKARPGVVLPNSVM